MRGYAMTQWTIVVKTVKRVSEKNKNKKQVLCLIRPKLARY